MSSSPTARSMTVPPKDCWTTTTQFPNVHLMDLFTESSKRHDIMRPCNRSSYQLHLLSQSSTCVDILQQLREAAQAATLGLRTAPTSAGRRTRPFKLYPFCNTARSTVRNHTMRHCWISMLTCFNLYGFHGSSFRNMSFHTSKPVHML